MIKIALCDTDINSLSTYKTWIEFWRKKNKALYSVHTFQTTQQLLSFFIRVSDFDILIINPSMKRSDGVAVVKKLRDLECRAEVIYFANSDEQLLSAFDTEPLYYYKKNALTSEIFGKIFMKAVHKAEASRFTTNVFTARSGSVIKRIPYDSIYYFEISNRIITVHYGDNQTFQFYSTIANVEAALNSNYFLRIHRSFIVNLFFIQTIESTAVTLTTGACLPVGITYSKLLTNVFSSSTA